jgi:hypothetical protein
MAPWTGEWDLHSISEKQGVLGLLAGKLAEYCSAITQRLLFLIGSYERGRLAA